MAGLLRPLVEVIASDAEAAKMNEERQAKKRKTSSDWRCGKRS